MRRAASPDNAIGLRPAEIAVEDCQEITAENALLKLRSGDALDHALIRELAAANVTFPQGIKLTSCLLVDADFRGAVFVEGADFHGSTFDGPARFGDDYLGVTKADQPWRVELGSQFDRPVDFSDCVFRGPLFAAGARFAGTANFRHTWFKDAVAFPGATFENKVWFVRARCDRSFSMWEATFRGDLADFSASTFVGAVSFYRSTFRQRCSFWGSEFQAGVTLHQARFEGDINFIKTRFAGVLDISRAVFSWPVDLQSTALDGTIAIRSVEAPRLLLEREQVHKRIESEVHKLWPSAQRDYGQLKNIFEANNDYASMDWAYYGFRRSRRRGARINRVHRAAEWLFLDVATGYGTKPFNIGLLITGAILAFGTLYASFPKELYYAASGLRPEAQGPTMDPLAAIYFSTATLTTIGLGDWIPRPEGWMRFAVTGESLLGLFLMALFVAMLTRRVIR